MGWLLNSFVNNKIIVKINWFRSVHMCRHVPGYLITTMCSLLDNGWNFIVRKYFGVGYWNLIKTKLNYIYQFPGSFTVGNANVSFTKSASLIWWRDGRFLILTRKLIYPLLPNEFLISSGHHSGVKGEEIIFLTRQNHGLLFVRFPKSISRTYTTVILVVITFLQEKTSRKIGILFYRWRVNAIVKFLCVDHEGDERN